jgi:hypothetical protein
MYVCKNLDHPQRTRCESCSTTVLPSTLEGKNSTFLDGKLYGLEMDIKAGYHIAMPLNSSYDNVSNQGLVSRSVQLDIAA